MYTYHAGTIWTGPALDGREESRFIRQCKDTKWWNAYLFLSWDSWCPTKLWQGSSSWS